jgi:coenzyme F420-reducing hydrogenase delta subunit
MKNPQKHNGLKTIPFPKQVCRYHCGNKEAQTKFEACQKIVRRIQFEKAISSDHAVQCVADTIRLEEFSRNFFPKF